MGVLARGLVPCVTGAERARRSLPARRRTLPKSSSAPNGARAPDRDLEPRRTFAVVARGGQRKTERFMCDYSLHGIASRPAGIGDKLVTTQFWNTTTRGFASISEPHVAVCLLPGTEVGFEQEVERELTGFRLLLWKLL